MSRRAHLQNGFARIEGVASNFRSDWQYVIAASRIDSALSLATLFSVLAVVTKFTDLESLGTPALYSLIVSSIIYLIALTLIKLRAPKFLQDFPDYKSYEDKNNSHRWILWQFFFNLTDLKRGFLLLHESIEKLLSFESARVDLQQCPFVPVYSGKQIEREDAYFRRDGSKAIRKMVVFKPVNFDRDLVMAFTVEEDEVLKRYVLPIREGDVNCEAKCKELFWIIFTEAAKENKLSRRIAFSLIWLSALLLFIAIFLAVFHSLTKGESPVACELYYV